MYIYDKKELDDELSRIYLSLKILEKILEYSTGKDVRAIEKEFMALLKKAREIIKDNLLCSHKD